MKIATIKDVAAHAGVSVATVSRVLNNPSTVKEQTREIVEQAIAVLNYSPNLLGKHLRQLQTKRILVLLDTISNQFYSRVVKGIEDKARQLDYAVMICTTRGSREHFLDHLKMLQNKVVDGVIIMCYQLVQDELSKLSRHYPIVSACEDLAEGVISSVGIDDFQASAQATNYLISRNNTKIAVLVSPNIDYTSSKRLQGYQFALKQHGIPFKESLVIREGYTYNSGIRGARKLLERTTLPDAIFSFSDAGAIGIIKEMAKHGVQVPKDISVMGFDNTAMSEIYQPSITTVGQPQYEIGTRAMELLMSKINGSQEICRVRLDHQIILRNSVK